MRKKKGVLDMHQFGLPRVLVAWDDATRGNVHCARMLREARRPELTPSQRHMLIGLVFLFGSPEESVTEEDVVRRFEGVVEDVTNTLRELVRLGAVEREDAVGSETTFAITKSGLALISNAVQLVTDPSTA